MFYKSLLISILIHLLILWAGSCLPFLTKRTQMISPFDQQPDYRIITLVELPPPPAVAGEESLAPSQGRMAAKSPKQTSTIDFLSAVKDSALLSSPAQGPTELPPIFTGNELAPVEKMTVPSQPVQPAEHGLPPSSQDQPKDFPLLLEAEVKAEAGAVNEEDQEEKDTPRSAIPRVNDTNTAEAEDDPVDGVESDLRTGFADSSTPGSNSDSSNGEKSTPPTGFEGDASPGLVKVFHTDPVYPRLARRRGLEGTVYLTFRITPEGQVHAVKITQSSGYELLDQAALEAVSQWRYTRSVGQPATADEETLTVKIRFQLEE